MSSAARTLSFFLVAYFGGWLAVAAFCLLRWHKPGFVSCAVTGAICVVPATLACLLVNGSTNKALSERLFTALGGMLLRFGAAVGGGLIVFLGMPYFQQPRVEHAYWGSLFVCYLGSLFLETIAVARSEPPACGSALTIDTAPRE